MAWGANEDGQLGIGTTKVLGPLGYEAPWVFSPMEVTDLSGVSSIAAGYRHTVAALEDGTVMAWGLNEDGQLGLGTNIGPQECEAVRAYQDPCSTAPIAVGGLSGVRAVAAGGLHSLALLDNGTVMAWGSNAEGQLGTGTASGPETCETPRYTDPIHGCSRTPVLVPGLSGVKAIAAGEWDSFALLQDGTVMAWGRNEWGELGVGSREFEICAEGRLGRCETTPTAIQGLSGVTAIAAGGDHTLALLKDGTVRAWGLNDSGELGDGSQERSLVPVPVQGLAGVSAIGAGSTTSLALLHDGTVVDWGSNNLGELGDGTSNGPEKCDEYATDNACSTHPVAVSGLSGVKAVAAGYEHSLALLEDDTVMAWGFNEYGALGTGDYGPEQCQPPQEGARCSRTPVMVNGLTGVTAIAVNAGSDDSVAYGPLTPTVTGIEGEPETASAKASATGGDAGPRAASKATPSNSGSELGGTPVTISGSDFSGATAVHFGAWEASSFTVTASGSMIAVSPPGTGTVDVTVTTPRGESPISSADTFRYVPPSPPTVTKVSPNRDAASGGGTVIIKGTGFSSATAVHFGPVTVTEFTRSGTSIQVLAPPGTSGPTDLTVTSPNGTSTISSKDRFTYEGPMVTGVSPSAGSALGGQTVTITGSGFAPGSRTTTFKFGKRPAGAVDCASTTTCTLVTPPARAGTVEVMAAVGKSKSKKSPPGDRYAYD